MCATVSGLQIGSAAAELLFAGVEFGLTRLADSAATFGEVVSHIEEMAK